MGNNYDTVTNYFGNNRLNGKVKWEMTYVRVVFSLGVYNLLKGDIFGGFRLVVFVGAVDFDFVIFQRW